MSWYRSQSHHDPSRRGGGGRWEGGGETGERLEITDEGSTPGLPRRLTVRGTVHAQRHLGLMGRVCHAPRPCSREQKLRSPALAFRSHGPRQRPPETWAAVSLTAMGTVHPGTPSCDDLNISRVPPSRPCPPSRTPVWYLIFPSYFVSRLSSFSLVHLPIPSFFSQHPSPHPFFSIHLPQNKIF